MSTFGGMYFTNKGRALQAKALTGVQLNFTRIAVGDGNLSGQAIQDLNTLVHEVKSIPINKLKNSSDGKSTVGGILSNQGLAIGFYYRELGLFAQDPVLGEILYCYGNAAALAEYIPADGGPDILEKQINVVAIIGDAPSVTATLNSIIQVSSVNGQTGEVVLTAENLGAAPASHTHDNRYYTETEIDTKFQSVASDLAEMETHTGDPTKHITAEERTAWNSKQNALTISSATNSSSTTQVANSAAVKAAYDLANAALPKVGGTMTGVLTAQNNTAYTTKQVRNITLSTASPSGGSNGDVWLTYV